MGRQMPEEPKLCTGSKVSEEISSYTGEAEIFFSGAAEP